MAETCIVCLGDLRTSASEDPPPDAAEPAKDGGKAGDQAKIAAVFDAKSLHDDEETIAHLLPCRHDLHNACLKPWVERANSCPTCRAIFNSVELSHYVGGPVVDSYPVQDKVQEAEIDPGMVVEEDELFDVEAWEPCILCGNVDDGHGTMYCDGCDRTVHVFCAGFDDAPEVWYCEGCLADMESDIALPGVASAMQRRFRRQNTGTARPQRRRRNNEATWARVWQEVSRRIDLDLDFPFDEEESIDHRTEEQRREFRRWQQRFEVASRQGTVNRLRGIATRLQPERPPPPEPESQEEIRAWNAFDKARESQDAPPAVRRRKRRVSASPASPHDSEIPSQPQLKRPRLTRPPVVSDQPESSNAAARRNVENPTFLTSLLREVENKPISAGSPAGSDGVNGQFSPRNSSPARSPSNSECGSPGRAATPPPQRPLSPPLSSAILPASSPIAHTFSPFSPTGNGPNDEKPDSAHRRGRGRIRRRPVHEEGDTSARHERASSPSTLSYSAKEEIQRMVKLALRPKYHDETITKDEYTDINRDVSRKLYELVKDASALADYAEREKWQDVAHEEVQKAVSALASAGSSDE